MKSIKLFLFKMVLQLFYYRNEIIFHNIIIIDLNNANIIYMCISFLRCISKNMEIELKTDWQIRIVELMKTIHGYKDPEYNDEVGSLDFMTQEEDQTKLMRALVDEDGRSGTGYMKTVSTTIEDVQDSEVDEVLIVADRFSSSARKLMKENDSVDYLSSKFIRKYRLSDLVYAIQRKTMQLCKQKCGSVPKSKDDCKGVTEEGYVCQIRRISDDSTFHAQMKWIEMLLEDFNKLVELANNQELSGAN